LFSLCICFEVLFCRLDRTWTQSLPCERERERERDLPGYT
jgi:hypothetical protein